MKSQKSKGKRQNQNPKFKTILKSFEFWVVVFTFAFLVFTFLSYADAVYFTDNTTEKGLIVEEYYDRFVFSTEEGEKELHKSKIDEIFFDEPYQNNFYLGKKFEREGNFENALKFYKLALQANPDFAEAQDAVKGLEDAKWRFKKSWRYSELKTALKAQLGLVLEDQRGVIKVESGGAKSPGEEGLFESDALVSCWAEPLTYAGIKNTSRLLTGLSNSILKVTVERDISVGPMPGLSIKPFAPLVIGLDPAGAVIKVVKKDSPPYRAGLREGDIITKIDGENTRYMKLAEITKKIFRAKGKRITVKRGITLMRKRAEPGYLKRAMWLWHSGEALQDTLKRRELLDFCGAKNIGTLFFQLQYEFLTSADGQKVCRILDEEKLREFLNDAHAAGLVVYSLDGAAAFCLQEEHPLVLSQLKAIIEFNKQAPPQQRFDGVHYDNEPYLLPDFESPKKGEIISQFIALNEKCAALIKESGSKLEFGIDIPFWFDSLDRLDKKLIDICDNVGIMAYRNFASGEDGMIYHAMDEIKYADKARLTDGQAGPPNGRAGPPNGRAGKRVFVGVETSKYPAQEVFFIAVLGPEEAGRLGRPGRFDGYDVRAYAYDSRVYAGLVKPAAAAEDQFMAALLEFAGLAGTVAKPQAAEDADSLIFDITAAISRNPEFRNARTQEYISSDGKACLLIRTDEVMLEKLTFADSTEKNMEAVLAEACAEFKRHPSFAGFAIHHYKSYKELCEKDSQ